jgi:hypothetical protein
VDGNNVWINLFNIDRRKPIENVPVKHQCSGNYFYGQDERLERAIKHVEDGYAQVVSWILQPGFSLEDGYRLVLRKFVLLQYMRTEAASLRSVEMQDGMREAVGTPVEGFRPTIKEAVLMAMHIYAEKMYAIDDLKLCLIRNRTDIPFVTSDDPAVMTNRWYLEDRRNLGRSPGLGSAGAVMFLPLSPRVLCLIYDGDVYSVAHTNGWVNVKRESDIRTFNQHQYMNCNANIYFGEWNDRQRIQADFEAVSSLRPSARHRVAYAVLDDSKGEWDRYRVVDRKGQPDDKQGLIHAQALLSKPSMWPSQLAWRRDGSAYTNDTGVGYVRRGTLDRQRGGGFRKIRTR